MTFDLGRVTTIADATMVAIAVIAVTFDLGRVTTKQIKADLKSINCGDVRSRTSYNINSSGATVMTQIAVTFDLGRVTTLC